MPVVLYAEFTAKPGEESVVADLIVGLGRDVRAEAGNVVFRSHTQAANPAKFFVYEEYVDKAAFQAHIAAPYGAVFNAKLNDLIEEEHSMLTFLTPLD